MPWRYQVGVMAFAAVGSWPFCAFGVALLAISAQDWNSMIQSAGAAVVMGAGGIATARVVYLKAYEGSAKQQVDENTRKIGLLEGDNVVLRAENQTLKVKIADRDRVIEARDQALRDRDLTIAARDAAVDEMMRVVKRLSADTADMAEAFLIRKGDAKSKGAP